MTEPEAGMNRPIRVLHLEDNPRDAKLIQQKLKTERLSCEIVWVDRKEAFESALARQPFDLVLADYSLPGYDGMSALRRVGESQPGVPVVIISGALGEEAAVQCLKAGAADYVLKQRPQRLGAAVAQTLREAEQRRKRLQAEEALRESEARVRLTIDTALDAVVTMDAQGLICDWSTRAEAVFGWKREEAVGQPVTELIIPPQYRADHARGLRQFLVSGEGPMLNRRIEITAMRRDGREFPVELSIAAMTVRGAWMFSGFARDISERRQQEQRIARLSRIHALLSGVNSLIVRTRERQPLFEEACRLAVERGGFRMAWAGLAVPGMAKVEPVAWAGSEEGYLNEVGLHLRDVTENHGCGGTALREKKPIVVNDIETDPRVVFKKEALARGYRSLAVLPLLVGDEAAGIFVLYNAQTGFFDQEEMALLADLAADISFALDSIAKTEEIDYLAYYDVMTGLANRGHFLDRLGQVVQSARAQAGKAAVTVIDIDRFKSINHTLGRHGGDAVLKCTARRLEEAIDSPEKLGRVGADAFGAVIARVEAEADIAGIVTSKLIPSLSAPLQIGGQELHLSAKIGIAVFPDDGADADTLLRNAEAALAKAKSGGEPFLFYAPHMNERVAEKLKLEARLRRALEQEQLVLHYQPKVDLGSGRISGLEALLRWNDPAAGLIPPLEFISVLEETGMILEAGRWAMEKVVSQYRGWLEKGIRAPRIAVNVSPIQLQRKDFAATVAHAVSGAADAAGALEIEITENLIMQDIEANIRKLREVQDMGVRVAIDDFGTGYSSLSYLARLPVNALKIDRSFIKAMMGGPDDLSIVSTIISLGHSLKLKVIAEGVETENQAKLLELLHCDEFQGYLFSPAVPAEQIEQLLRETKSPPG